MSLHASGGELASRVPLCSNVSPSHPHNTPFFPVPFPLQMGFKLARSKGLGRRDKVCKYGNPSDLHYGQEGVEDGVTESELVLDLSW